MGPTHWVTIENSDGERVLIDAPVDLAYRHVAARLIAYLLDGATVTIKEIPYE